MILFVFSNEKKVPGKIKMKHQAKKTGHLRFKFCIVEPHYISYKNSKDFFVEYIMSSARFDDPLKFRDDIS